MYDADSLVKHARKGSPNGFETVTDTYRFEPQFKNGQVSKVEVIFRPRQGYTIIMYLDGKTPVQRSTTAWLWGSVAYDLRDALLQHQFDLFTIKDPRRP